jgi:nucleoside-diphosphate-sugar epimerase
MRLTNWENLHGSHFDGARVLITGGAGFIGSHLAEALSGLGASVIVLDDLCGGSVTNLIGFGPVEFVEGSILDSELVAKCARECRYVFHQAALGSVPRSVELPRLYCDVNITGTLNVLEAARDAQVQRVMFAASSSAYGNCEKLPKSESFPVQPVSPYASSKVAGEALMRAYSASYGIDTACLRYFNIFGPRQNANSAYAAVIAAFADTVLRGQRPKIFGDGEQSRDFTYVDNAVHANLLAARCAQPIRGEVFNIACGTRISVTRLAMAVLSHLGNSHVEPIYAPPRAGDVLHSQADLTRAATTLGYAPIVDFQDGLAQTLDWYREKTQPAALSA